jgi:hypothetical protein
MSNPKRGSVPFVVSYKKVSRRPKVKTKRRFVGIRGVFKNVVGKITSEIDEIFFTYEQEIMEQGVTKVVHWAIDVNDPWGVNERAGIVATRLPEIPPCGTHYEITMLDPSMEIPTEPQQVNGAVRRPPNHEEALKRMREALVRDGHYDPEAGTPPE